MRNLELPHRILSHVAVPTAPYQQSNLSIFAISAPSSNLLTCIVHELNQPPSAPNSSESSQPSQGESNFGDSSRPLFTMYSKIAEGEDNEMVERCMLMGLISSYVPRLPCIPLCANQKGKIERFILCRRRCTCHCIHPRLPAQLTGYIRFLPRENVSASSCSQHIPPISPSDVAQPPAFSPTRYAICVNSL